MKSKLNECEPHTQEAKVGGRLEATIESFVIRRKLAEDGDFSTSSEALENMPGSEEHGRTRT